MRCPYIRATETKTNPRKSPVKTNTGVLSRGDRGSPYPIPPDVTDSIAKIIRPIDNTAVGNRGTIPYSKYTIITGIARPTETSVSKMPITVKNGSGLSDR